VVAKNIGTLVYGIQEVLTRGRTGCLKNGEIRLPIDGLFRRLHRLDALSIRFLCVVEGIVESGEVIEPAADKRRLATPHRDDEKD
jgi:hypothetical protein